MSSFTRIAMADMAFSGLTFVGIKATKRRANFRATHRSNRISLVCNPWDMQGTGPEIAMSCGSKQNSKLVLRLKSTRVLSYIFYLNN